MMSGQWLTVGAGFAFAFLNAKVQEQRKARIERVNSQLKLFYGPLLAAVSATHAAYSALVAQHSPDGTRASFQRAVHAEPSGPEAVAYRLWCTSVLQPLNEQAAAIVSDHIDQLDSADLIPELLQLVAHVATMRVVLQRWERGDLAASSAITYPDRLLPRTQTEFNRVKTRQAELLGEEPPKLMAAEDAVQLALRGPAAVAAATTAGGREAGGSGGRAPGGSSSSSRAARPAAPRAKL
ncbi:hypothetical protein Rsub_03122 [Raphidocelis subcapitata]|uniref:Uncharacterized protein n=1 Tax=Raphidocelis subcapitata TaxID=307507 RepID=A0A2V0NSD9_9CHLO|nr:hypothetical protein Rsub_03122 [Raphidocelis subcapitata]|eukprot:GBF90551.1 hypothetical protein Rsub_03122 [Raphidocelis subcapitata]